MRKTISAVMAFLILFSSLAFGMSAEAATYIPDVELYSKAYMLINLDDDTHPVVAQKNENERMFPASLTKIVTAMVVLENVSNLNEQVEVSKQAYDSLLGTGAQVAGLKIGDVLTVEELLYLTLVHSACDATEVLAEYVGGTKSHFVSMMNDYAKGLGCTGTNFENPDGLHSENHYTTAADMAIIALAAIQNETFVKMSETVQYKFRDKTTFYHTNLMLRSGFVSYYYKYARGIKTGSTEEAGYCVITRASKDGYNYLAVVLGAPVIDYNKDGYKEKCSFIDAASLFKWAFNSLKYSTVAEKNEVLEEIAVKNGKDADTVQLVAKKDVTVIVPNSLDKSAIIVEAVDKPAEISAPVAQGDSVCKANIIYGEQVIATVDLVAANDVELSTFLKLINAIKSFFSLTAVKIVFVAVVAFIVVYALLVVNNYKKKQERRRRREQAYYEEEN